MGFSPQQIEAMSLYQFAACVDGVNRSNGGEASPEPPSAAEFDAMLERHADFLTVH